VHKIVPEDVNSNLVTTLFNEGKAAMVLNGPWFRGEIKDTLNWGVAPMPKVVSTGLAMRPYMGSEAVLMSKKSTKKEAAFEVMKYLTGEESGRIRMKVGGQPVAVKSVWSDADVDPVLAAFKDQLPESVIMPNGANMKAVWSPTDQAIYKIVKTGEPAEDVIKTTEERIAASLK
jgi:arabinogalactan oligomer/maltooligosaccharide transport system substrate-binding protein